MGVRGCRTGGRRVLALALAVSLGKQAGAGDRSGSDRCANQECATSFIVFGHAFLPLLHKTSSASFRR